MTRRNALRGVLENQNRNDEGNKMNDLVEQTAQLLEGFSQELASAWRTQPFRRVDLAHAFAAGFVNDPSEDVHPTAMVVLEAAYRDRETRLRALSLTGGR